MSSANTPAIDGADIPARGRLGSTVANPRLREMLVDHLEGAVAMEQNSARMLGHLSAAVREACSAPGVQELGIDELTGLFEDHQRETSEHERLLRERLVELGQDVSMSKEIAARITARGKALADMVRPDKPGRSGRDAFVAEQLEIASYELLERLAGRTGDDQTAELARRIRAEEEAMAGRIAERWDKFLDVNLVAESATEEPLERR